VTAHPRSLTAAPVGALLCAAATLSLAAGCTPKKRIIGDGRIIQKVRFIGAERLGHGRLLRHLHAAHTRWVPMSPDHPYDPAVMAVDARRLVALYRSHGYLQARVIRTEVRPHDRDDPDAPLTSEERDVDLLFHIHEGKPTKIGRMRIVWSPAASKGRRFRAAVEKAAGLKVGGRFSVVGLNGAIGSMRAALLNRGHPLARVSGSAEINAMARRADVLLRVDPGPRARIGRVRFVGRKKVPAYLLNREVAFAIGEPYTPQRVRQIEGALKGMRVFRWVASEPPTGVEDGRVDLTIRLSEADPQRIRLGFEASFDDARWQQQVRSDYTHTNVDGHLTRLHVKALAGWAELPDPFAPLLHGPVLSLAPSLGRKGILEDHLYWSVSPKFEVDLRQGYQYQAPSNRLGVSRWFGGIYKATLSHNIRRVDFFNISPTLDAGATILGKDFRDPFVLSYLQLRGQLFAANSIARPTDGVIGDARYNFSSGAFMSAYDFHELRAGARAYWRPTPRLQLAARLRVGTIVPFGSERAGSPLSYRYYLGGATTVRGWGSRRLSPRVSSCDDQGVCSDVPVGGQSFVQANLEARLLLKWKVHVVAFADVGDVQAEALKFVPTQWHVTVGPGLRWRSMLGKVRLDVGWRVVDPGIYREARSWGLHFGMGETF